MLIVNGRKFARTDKEFLGTLFRGDGTASGTYRKVKGGYHMYKPNGELFAALIDNGRMVGFVSAYRQEDGKPRYMFALRDLDASYLGLSNATLGEQRQAAIEAIESTGVR